MVEEGEEGENDRQDTGPYLNESYLGKRQY